MPKPLSLKKAQPTLSPSKKQKAITHFFKNAVSDVLKIQVPVANDDKKPGKRKASCSPEVVEIHEPTNTIDKSMSNDNCSKNTPKKPKTDILSMKRDKMKSPLKENGFKHKTSPRKVIDTCEIKIGFETVDKIKLNLDQKEKLCTPCLDNNNKVDNQNDKSCLMSIENYVEDIEFKSPVKTPGRKSRTPKKSPIQEFHCTPVSQLRTPEKSLKTILSPSKCGSTAKVLNFIDIDNDFGEAFGDEWDVDAIDEGCIKDLDLSRMQRCEILSVQNNSTCLSLKLKNNENNKGTCIVEGIWLDTPLKPGDIISVLASRNPSGFYSVNNTCGMLVIHPDHLMSATSVVAGVFCQRKAVLQERWKGIDSSNTAMTIGILIHELVQKALTHKMVTTDQLSVQIDNLIKQSIQMLYDAGLSEEEARMNMKTYVTPLADFLRTYVADGCNTNKGQNDKNNWSEHVDKVLDIEENICCPQLGLKGKIDATLQVTIHDRKGNKPISRDAIVPLELKSGKASVSAEHRGQLVLYGMMLALQRNEDPTTSVQQGLLLYLKERVDLREVSCGIVERRDLMMLRNQLVQFLAGGPRDIDTEQLTDIEDASALLQQKLPEPVHHEMACTKCPYLTLCSIHLWHTEGPSVSEKHPLSKLRDQALGHLSPEHIKYFLHWTALLRIEERVQMTSSPLHALWTDSVDKRSKKGTCASNLILKSVEVIGDRYMHKFKKQNINKDVVNEFSGGTKGPQEGEFSIVSIENRPWIAAGVISLVNEKTLHILLERDLSRRLSKETVYNIDTYESYATTVQNLTNLGVLMEDSDRALRLRNLIIDKASPQFEAKLSREVGRLGSKLMRSLNIEQQRAVLKALAAKHYALLQGLPGTGKTQTISVLIQMLVALKKRVLVTAHTHSAVDTVLSRLPKSLRVMRLGSSSRMAASLLDRSERTLTARCETPEQLSAIYDSMEVVGVTCLGATHAMLARTNFDICIVDEATQVLQCTVLRPLFAAEVFVLVGDPDQLPPVVRSRAARRLGMEESLFHRLMNVDATVTLRLQYRMNEAIVSVANTVAYDNRLKCADEQVAQAKCNIDLQKISNLITKASWLQMACSPELEHSVLFLDTHSAVSTAEGGTSRHKSCLNVDEACIVMVLVNTLKEVGIDSSDIGVMAPYREQVALLRRALANLSVEVSTVDQFQGRDKSVIIYSCTKHHDRKNDKTVKEGEILNDQRRLAVSVTRAKHKLIVVGNSVALRHYSPLQRLIEASVTITLDKEHVRTARDQYESII